MGSDTTWVICKHVMDGSADHIKMRPEKICLCSACVDRIDLVKTKEICILNQSRLEGIIESIEKIDGLWHLGKYRNPRGKLVAERRTHRERRSSIDRRLDLAYLNAGEEKRRHGSDRRLLDRRIVS